MASLDRLDPVSNHNDNDGEDQYWMFEFFDAYLDGLHAESFVPGSLMCAGFFRMSEMNLAWMNQFLIHEYSLASLEEQERTFFNVTLSVFPYVPYTAYFCYRLPGITRAVW